MQTGQMKSYHKKVAKVRIRLRFSKHAMIRTALRPFPRSPFSESETPELDAHDAFSHAPATGSAALLPGHTSSQTTR